LNPSKNQISVYRRLFGPGKVNFKDSDWGINKLIAGSPLIAIEKLNPENSKKISCIFIENDAKNFNDLEAILVELKMCNVCREMQMLKSSKF